MTLSPTKWRQILIACILLGVILRLATLSQRSVWLDEVASLRFATLNDTDTLWNELVDTPSSPRHPALYYIVLKYAIQLGGDSEAVLRLPTALLSIAGIFLLYLISQKLFPKTPQLGLFVAALFALSPLDLWYAHEARMYVPVAVMGMVVALGLAHNNWLGGILVAIGLGAGLYFDFTMIPLAAGLVGVWLVYWWRDGRKIGSFVAIIAGISLGWWFFQPWWQHTVTLLNNLNNVTVFILIREALNLPNLPVVFYITLLAGAIVAIIFTTILLRKWLENPASRKWLGGLILLGFMLATALFAVPRLYTIKRILVTGWWAVLFLPAWLAYHYHSPTFTKQRLITGLLSVALAATIVTQLTPKDDWRRVTAYLNDNLPPNSVVWVDPRWNTWMINDYYGAKMPAQTNRTTSDTDNLANAASLNTDIWLIAERFNNQTPSSVSEAWLDQNWQLIDTKEFARLELRHYQPR